MAKLLLRLLVNALAVMVAAYVVPGLGVDSFYTAVIVALLLAVINVTIKPILLILTLPITIFTFGLFAIVINSALFWWLGTIVQGFSVAGFVSAFIGSLIVSLVAWFGHSIFRL
jgi:putative membrane protein